MLTDGKLNISLGKLHVSDFGTWYFFCQHLHYAFIYLFENILEQVHKTSFRENPLLCPNVFPKSSQLSSEKWWINQKFKMTEILNGEEILLKLRNFFQQMHSSTTELNHIPILNKFFLGNLTSLLITTYDSLTLYTFISVCIFSILLLTQFTWCWQEEFV